MKSHNLKPKGRLVYEIHDKHGNLVKKGWRKTNTSTYNFAIAVCAKLFGTNQTLKDMTGTLDANVAIGAYCNGGAAQDYRGVIVGIGGTIPTARDSYTMETIINHGVAANQLQYGATTITKLDVWPSTAEPPQFIIGRPFTNGSGSSVVIKEVALMIGSGTTAAVCYMLDRTLVSDITVLDTETVTLKYVWNF